MRKKIISIAIDAGAVARLALRLWLELVVPVLFVLAILNNAVRQ